MKATLKMPRLSMNMEEATLAKWRKKPGERFAKGEPLYEIETEKVTTDVEAPCDGTLLQIIAEESAVVAVGGPVCTIET